MTNDKVYSISKDLLDNIMNVLKSRMFISDGEDEDNDYDVIDLIARIEVELNLNQE
jgi:hypothetical protein